MAGLPVNAAALLTWVFLVAASMATYTIVEGHRLSVGLAVSIVMGIAVLKARMIVLHFMEMKHASRAWRLALELWVLLAASLILGLWFLAGGAPGCNAS